jgi:hypothetical protein
MDAHIDATVARLQASLAYDSDDQEVVAKQRALQPWEMGIEKSITPVRDDLEVTGAEQRAPQPLEKGRAWI